MGKKGNWRPTTKGIYEVCGPDLVFMSFSSTTFSYTDEIFEDLLYFAKTVIIIVEWNE